MTAGVDLLSVCKEAKKHSDNRPGRVLHVMIAHDLRYDLALLARYSHVSEEVLASAFLDAGIRKASELLEGLR